MIHIHKFTHHAQTRIGIHIPYEEVYIEKIKKVHGALWSPNAKSWHIPYNKETWQLFLQVFEGEKFEIVKEEADTSALEIQNIPAHKIEVFAHPTNPTLLQIKLPNPYQQYLERIKKYMGVNLICTPKCGKCLIQNSPCDFLNVIFKVCCIGIVW